MEAAKTLIGIVIGAAIFASQVSAQSFLTNGLVAYYPFNGNANDASGNGNNLTNYGAQFSQNRFGAFRAAYYFDGADYLGSSISPLSQGSNWTVTAWIQPSLSQAAAYAVCVGYDNGSSGDGFAIGISGGGDTGVGQAGNQFWAFFPGYEFDFAGYQFTSVSAWYEVAMSCASDSIALYVNGLLATNFLTAPTIPTGFEVGSGGGSHFFTGAVDDVRVYNRALSATEVRELYDDGQINRPPVILIEPTSEILGFGGDATFVVGAASGIDGVPSTPIAYQWMFNGADISGATNSDLVLTNVRPSQQGTYNVVVSNATGVVASSNAFLSVATSPLILSQPRSSTLPIGGSATFSVTADGAPPMFYQWSMDGVDIGSATNPVLLITNLQPAQAGTYSVVISNAYGTTISSNAALTVVPSFQSGMVAYYPFNGNANDQSGNGNNLINYGGATLCADRFGVPNNAYYFDGSDYLGSPVPPITQSSNWTITAWMRPTVLPQASAYVVCVGYDDGTTGDGFGMGISGPGGGGAGYGQGLWALFPGIGAFPGRTFVDAGYQFTSTNQWHELVMSCASDTITLHLDGLLTTNFLIVPAIPTAFKVGSAGNPTFNFRGAIDDVRVYNRTLSDTEVQELYAYDQSGLQPYFLAEPTNEIANIGANATFAIVAADAYAPAALSYQWKFNGTNISGATTPELTLGNVNPTQQGVYNVTVSNSFAVVVSSNAFLTVATSPLISSQSQNANLLLGASATLAVTAFGPAPILYQWSLDGVDIDSATNSKFSITNLQPAQAGTYAVVVSNAYGMATSSNILLSVLPDFDSGLVGYYPFNGNASDESGYGNDLTNYGATLCADRFGESDSAYYFNGSNYLGSAISPLNQVDNWTVTAWIQPAPLAQATAYAVCVGYDNEDSGDGFAMGISGGGGERVPAQVGNQLWAFFPGVVFDYAHYKFATSNEWYQLVMTRASGTTTLYVNGISTSNSPAIQATPTAPTSFEIGSGGPDRYGPDRYFKGAVDDVRVYNHPLSEQEVLELYNYEANPVPYIFSDPASGFVNAGANFDFAVGIIDSIPSAPLSYQWILDGASISGATNSDLILTNVQLAQQGTYSVTVSNFSGIVASSNALMTVITSPQLVSQPGSSTFSIGGAVTLSITAVGPAPLSYQWSFDGGEIEMATDSSFSVTNLQPSEAGTYRVVVSNAYGTTASSNAIVTVLPAFESGLVAYYPFNGNANDESGNGNTLTNYGATLCADRFGNPNSAYYFNGSNYLGTSIPPLSQNDDWTITAWIEPASLSQELAYAVCAGYDNGHAGDGYTMAISGGDGGQPGNQLWAVFPGVGFSFGGFDFTSTNEWHQVVMSRASGLTIFYVDGNATSNSPPISTAPANPTALSVGSGGASGRFFNGAVDDVHIYNRALTTAEILDLYRYEANSLPFIFSAPTNEIVNFGDNAVFVVNVVDTIASAPLSYQWKFDGANISDATNSDLILTNVQPARHGTYSVVISNFAGVVSSSNALLTVVTSPLILIQPQSSVLAPGASAMLSIGATGPTLSYQWFMNRVAIKQATNSTFLIMNFESSEAGTYHVVVKNPHGSKTSSNALLSVMTLQETLTNGLVAYYPFNGSPNDQSQHGNDLTNYGAELCSDRFGAPNRAYRFSGTNYLGTDVSPLIQIDNWTVAAWIQPEYFPQTAGYAVCVGYDSGSSGDGFAMGISDTNQLWGFFPGLQFFSDGYRFTLEHEWNHVIMCRNSGVTAFYVNGDLITNGSSILIKPFAPTSFEVGSGGSDRFFIGSVDDVRVYDRALLASEAREIYNYETNSSPFIQSNLTNEITGLGAVVDLAVVAGGMPPLTYKWNFNGKNLANDKNSSIILTNVHAAQAGTYSVTVSNAFGSVTSFPAVLTVAASPVIVSQPQSQSVAIGESAEFSAAAVGAAPLYYQWRLNGMNIQKANNSMLFLTNLQTTQAGPYSVVVSNKYGSITSSNAALTVEDPGIVVQPQSQGVLPGSTAAFSAVASGASLNYQWLFNDEAIPGQTGSSLAITNSGATNEGEYSVVISNKVGVVTSSPAALNIQKGTAFLDPRAFLSLGSFNSASKVVIDASTGLMSGGASFAGVPVTNAGFPMWVFAFSSFTVQSGVEVIVTNGGSGASGVALLSKSDVIIDGTVNASASSGSASYCGPGAGTSGGTISYPPGVHNEGGGGGGGGFGGNGGYASQGGVATPGVGGSTYNSDITAQLADGSCGGAGGGGGLSGYAGDGGGALHIEAVGTVTISGSVIANGEGGTQGIGGGCRDASEGSGGGGSGGSILILASNVVTSDGATLTANGGSGGAGGVSGGGYGSPCFTIISSGGGGGGGRIVVDYLFAGTNNGSITASGGAEGAINSESGSDGTIFFGHNPVVLPFPNVAVSHGPLGTIVLTWPATATNYTLQISAEIGPGAVWNAVPDGIAIGENTVLGLSLSNPAAFFRLKQN